MEVKRKTEEDRATHLAKSYKASHAHESLSPRCARGRRRGACALRRLRGAARESGFTTFSRVATGVVFCE